MILAFMIAYSYGILLYRLLKSKCTPKTLSLEILEENIFNNETFEIAYNGTSYWEDGVCKFAPPVYVQRYMVVHELLEELGPFKKVVDIGCAELSFFNYLKNLVGLEELLLVDQDEELLKWKCDVVRPLNIDYLKPRESPLIVKILNGNAAVPDSSLAGSLAVTAIELIEHMFPPDLDELPYTLFGVIQPEVVIITTPNYDFNIVFNKTDFRHLDHKFEWTRQQFKDWVNNLAVRYPNYTPKLYGIGPGPDSTAQHGTCTQMVLFKRNSTAHLHTSHFIENSYNVILEVNYPYEPRTEVKLEDKVKYEAEKFILYAVQFEGYHTNDQIEIPLNCIMRMVTKHTDSKELLQAVLKDNKWRIEENESGEKCVVLPSSGIPYSSSSSECLESSDVENRSGSEFNETIYCNDYRAQNNFTYDSDESWPDTEDVTTVLGPPPVYYNESSSLISCVEPSLSECSFKQKGCDQKLLKDLIDPLDVSLSYKCGRSCSKVENIHTFNLCDLPEKMSEQKPMIMETNPNNVFLESCATSTTIVEKSELIKKNNCKGLPYVTEKIDDVNDDGLECINPPILCKNISDSNIAVASSSECLENKSDSFDIEQKLENELSDRFDESRIPSHSIKKDMFSVKRSLDLPLDPVAVNVNGNFEIGSPACRGHREAKTSCYYASESGASSTHSGDMKLSKNVITSGITDLSWTNANNVSKASSSLGVNNADVCLFSSDLRGPVYSDCREKVDLRGGCINRCLSLQHIKEKEGGTKSNRFSLCCEKENINICDIFKDTLRTKSCGHSFDEVIDLLQADTVPNFDDSCSQSKAADSGYPNTSDREMDMDLTPEQVDELLSENDSSLDEREEEEPGIMEGVGGAVPIQFLDHVENGDVANNNRDGEGNNLDQEEVGQPLHFQQLIQEEANNPPLDELPPHPESDSDNEDKFLSCTSVMYATALAVDVPSDRDKMRTLGWTDTDASFCSHSRECTSTDSSTILASSSTSLQVHPSSSETLSVARSGDRFPSWLLTILVDEIEVSRNDILDGNCPSDGQILSHSSLQDDEWSELVVPGDILGGGEPHSEL